MNRHRALDSCLRMISAQTLRVCREGKPLHTFPDHALGRSSRGPENGVCEDSLVARVLPDRRLVAERRIEYASRAERSLPGEWPTIEALMHTGLAGVHRALVEAQEHA